MSEESFRHYSSFLKVGERKHMESLINDGLVFCKPLNYFSQIESKDFRGDPNEGVAYIKQVANLEILIDGKVIGTANQGQLYYRHPDDLGNIYCMYGIETNTLNLTLKKLQKFNLNMNGLKFGDTAVFIFDPAEFISRVQKALELKGFTFQYSPIIYYDPETHEGELSPFNKSIKYSEQNEVRFWIPNNLALDLTVEIGNMSDISYLISKAEIDALEYEPL